MCYIYVLKSIKTQKRYVGSTRIKPEERCRQHNKGGKPWTRVNKPLMLVYQEHYSTYSEARKREIFLKSGAGRKFLDNILKDVRVSAEGGSASG